MNKKLIYLSVFLILALFIVSACQSKAKSSKIFVDDKTQYGSEETPIDGGLPGEDMIQNVKSLNPQDAFEINIEKLKQETEKKCR